LPGLLAALHGDLEVPVVVEAGFYQLAEFRVAEDFPPRQVCQ